MLSAAAAVPAVAKVNPPSIEPIDPEIVKRNDEAVQRHLDKQVMDQDCPWFGAFPDGNGLHHAAAAGHAIRDFTASYLHPKSKFHQSDEVENRIRLAAEFLTRTQSPDGNIDLLVTNFNSPPDTGFVVRDVGSAAAIARDSGAGNILEYLKTFMVRAGRGMAKGGIHTPNHRWVVSAALAKIHDVFPAKELVERIDRWLAEGIDIDVEGQYTERSTTIYNPVVDASLVTVAHKLNCPELLDPVRKNLEAMLFLLHADFEVVTDISRRQDVNTRGTMSHYWYPLRYIASLDGDGRFATIVDTLEPEHARLALLMEYPQLRKPLPPRKPIPNNYVKDLPRSGITRIRRGKRSATLSHRGSGRLFSVRKGKCVVEAVRVASAFFGKAQFVPSGMEMNEGEYVWRQDFEAPYYQPLDPPQKVGPDGISWSMARSRRERTEICRLGYLLRLKEIRDGFEMSFHAEGTDNVPLALEVNLREGGELSGCNAVSIEEDSYVLEDEVAQYRVGNNVLRIGPGLKEHSYTQIRGARPKLPGPSVYFTAFTPVKMKMKLTFA